jgi:thiamine biosynthesis lipoprotein
MPPRHSELGSPDIPPAVSRRDLLSAAWARDRDTASHWIRVHRRAMACRFEVTLPGDRAAEIAAAREALLEADRLEALLSVFREASEISRINHAPAGHPVPVSEDLFDLLALCRDLSTATEGAFDITTTPLSRCWGFLQREGRLPPDDEIAAARSLVGPDRVHLDSIGRTVALDRPGAALNLGAIGKGYAVQAVGMALWRRGVRNALVSAGGSSVIALGGPDSGWTVEVTASGPTRRLIARLRLRNAALGTSGAGEQFIEVDGRRYGHVIDPRTGHPSSGILSASVVTADAASADALATAFFVGGLELARRYCDAHPGTLAILAPDDRPGRPLVIGRYLGAAVEV